MRKNIKISNFICLCLSVSLFAGCGNTDIVATDIFNQNQSETAMLPEAELNYEVPVTYPSIMVDLLGYDAKGDKEAVIVSDTLPAVFEVRDSKTDEVVYRSSVKRKASEDPSNEVTGVADFSSVTDPGRYYIKTEILGKSKDFEIKENVYSDLLKSSFDRLHALRCDTCHVVAVPLESDATTFVSCQNGWHTSDDGEKDVVEACLSVMDICTAYDFYPNAFSDNYGYGFSGNKIPDLLDEAGYELKWLLKMQNSETGGVYTSVSLQNVTGKEEKELVVVGETTRATAYFCACMAKASVTYKKLDSELSGELFQAAVLAWNCLEANKEIVGAEQMYRASVEMYKATGQDVYNQIILDYLKDHADNGFENRIALDSAITYISTPRATNVELCTGLMADFMDRTEGKVELAEKSCYQVESVEMTCDELLRNTYELIVVDYIISSNAYEPLEKDYIHYLGGRNSQSINYINEIKTPDTLVKLISLCGKLSLD